LLIFHILADFGKFFSHRFSHSYNGRQCALGSAM
jgi:hypothetical protein